ncbi:DUF4837 family protein [Rubricoccus marinus]|uniref:DUF4837 domain-containing protein n=1 Tax=Rubricoccus marinus TaxID=716817 RepID=A0A259TXY3_9BACT|nr:DUF4837 family protein [Rubricoccus marinus]OZC02612.1 hypothetical protein BSZ36_06265 [Rubricoccus marinus]
MIRLRLAVFALLASGAALLGCERSLVGLQPAVGAIPEILVVTDSATWAGTVGDAVRQELAKPIMTLPNQQGAFKLRYQPLASQFLSQIRETRNVIFVAPIGVETPIGEYIRARIPEGQQGAIESGNSVAVTIRENLWAAGQIAVTATAANDSLLASAIIERGDSLRAAFDRNVLATTTREMFDAGRQNEIETELLASRGWTVAMQHDYVQIQDSTLTVAGRTGDFIRFRRVIPDSWRDFFVFTQDGVSELPSDDEMDRLTDGLLEVFARGEEDDSYVQQDFRRPMVRETLPLAGREARETRGLWFMVEDLMGGAFIRYAFVDPETDRLYLYYGMTFAPSRTLDKREFLRQMEAIATTFRTTQDEARAEAEA